MEKHFTVDLLVYFFFDVSDEVKKKRGFLYRREQVVLSELCILSKIKLYLCVIKRVSL